MSWNSKKLWFITDLWYVRYLMISRTDGRIIVFVIMVHEIWWMHLHRYTCPEHLYQMKSCFQMPRKPFHFLQKQWLCTCSYHSTYVIVIKTWCTHIGIDAYAYINTDKWDEWWVQIKHHWWTTHGIKSQNEQGERRYPWPYVGAALGADFSAIATLIL